VQPSLTSHTFITVTILVIYSVTITILVIYTVTITILVIFTVEWSNKVPESS
jgi:hypothetical protein